MASKEINTRIKHKRDTSANWETNNPVLLDGEIILVDTNVGELRSKTGNGVKTYTQLPFNDERLLNLINKNKEELLGEIGQVYSVPPSTTNNNGKFLRVVNGVVAWETVPNAEEMFY